MPATLTRVANTNRLTRTGAPLIKKPKVAAYCRVSTDTDEQQISFDTQVTTYQERILSNPAWEYAGVYTDDGFSGTIMSKRPGFMQMMEDAEEGKIDRILTKSISRFARNTIDCVNCVRHLKERGITILFEKENIDTGTSASEMYLTILSAFAQEESRSISSNTKWSIAKKFEEGKDRWCNLYGYKRDEDTGETYIVVEPEAFVVREIFNLYECGNSIVNICDILKKKKIPAPNGKKDWDPNRVRQILINEKYSGDIILQKMFTESHLTHKTVLNEGEFPQYLLKNHHTPIVSKEQFKRCNEIRMMRSNRKTGHDDYPFGKKIICPYCGKPMIQQKVIARGQHHAWRCEEDPFLIYSEHIELAVLEAYRSVDTREVARIVKEGYTDSTLDEDSTAEPTATVAEGSKDIDPKTQAAKDFLFYRANPKNFKSIEYYWVDRIIDKITFGEHIDRDSATLTVHWKFGLETTVPTGVDLKKKDPEVLWNMDRNSKYRNWVLKLSEEV
jgi:DNA invertase Pin-like site-specific DNA recombinase/sarcosine oxidase delta subunit